MTLLVCYQKQIPVKQNLPSDEFTGVLSKTNNGKIKSDK